MSRPVLHQLIIGATPRDAITQNAILWQRWLQEAGYVSEIYATSIDDGCKSKIRPWHSYQTNGQEKGLIYHHSLGSPIVDQLLSQHASSLIPVYHNVTPAHWFAGSHPELVRLTKLGVTQLNQMGSVASAGIGVSEFNCSEMRAAGFKNVTVVPITFEAKQFEQTEPVLLNIKKDGPVLLFVGRLSPNKCQEDLVRLLYACKKLESGTQLVLIGSHWMPAYVDWVRYVAEQLGVAESVHLLGSVSFAEMAGGYCAADLYVSLSEHEGFGMPLIESMHFELPILAYRSTAVTGTLGGASVTVGEKKYNIMAQLVMDIWQDKAWQQRIIGRQNKQLQNFLEPQVKAIFFDALTRLNMN
ncbi:MAG: glycosyltransferase involved in cell wall biosynthesis [Cellvibrionaceae bacterium]|jgi:glycosyltransferase involved in cell wall biosynthesis